MENWQELSINYHQIPSLPVPLSLSETSSSFLYCVSEQWRLCTGSSMPSVLAYMISNFLMWSGWSVKFLYKNENLQPFLLRLPFSFVETNAILLPDLWLYNVPLKITQQSYLIYLLMPYSNNKVADQPVHLRLWYSLSRQNNTFTAMPKISSFCVWAVQDIQNFKTLGSFCSRAGQFECYLVRNPQRQVFSWRD